MLKLPMSMKPNLISQTKLEATEQRDVEAGEMAGNGQSHIKIKHIRPKEHGTIGRCHSRP